MRWLTMLLALAVMAGCQRRTLSDQQAQGLANSAAGQQAAVALADELEQLPPVDEAGSYQLTREELEQLVNLVRGAAGWMRHAVTNLDLPGPEPGTLELFRSPPAARAYAVAGEQAARNPAPAGIPTWQKVAAGVGGTLLAALSAYVGLRKIPGTGALLAKGAALLCEKGPIRNQLLGAIDLATGKAPGELFDTPPPRRRPERPSPDQATDHALERKT